MTSISEVSRQDFPVDELLTLLGGSVSRLALLEEFSQEQAARLSDSQFLNEDLHFLSD
jgi:hypothetical protein